MGNQIKNIFVRYLCISKSYEKSNQNYLFFKILSTRFLVTLNAYSIYIYIYVFLENFG